MKNIAFVAFVASLAGLPFSLSAQITKEQQQERKEMIKASKSELNEKATKSARKEAKRLSREGWTPAPGALPVDLLSVCM